MGWNEGYITDIGYTHIYVPLTNPFRAALPLLHAGLAPPRIRAACELGFGQGISIAINAAAQPDVEWWGVDFMPDHVAFARALVEDTGIDCRLTDQSFAEFCARDDLPEFDAVVIHGVWSWISDGNRAIIADFLKRRLAVGGVVYLGYNVEPGWAPQKPLRHLMGLHARLATPPGRPSDLRAMASLDFVDRLVSASPDFAKSNPDAARYFRSLKDKSRTYVAHEFLNESWSAAPFSETSERLSEAKLTFAATAEYADHVRKLPPEQQALLDEAETTALRESVRDVMTNARFRKDYWIKGAVRLAPRERLARIKAERFVLVELAAKVTVADRCGVEQAAIDAVVAALADQTPKSLGEIEAALPGFALETLIEAVLVLTAAKQAAPAIGQGARETSDRLNLKLIERAEGGENLQLLASPVIGGAVQVSRAHQIFLGARMRGRDSVRGMAEHAWEVLSSQGKCLVKDGRPLKTAEENIPEFEAMAEAFVAGELRMLQGLGVAR